MTAPAPVTGSDLDPEAEPVVVYDLFPAEVTYEGVVYRDARVIVTRERVLVYTGGKRRTAELALGAVVDFAASTIPQPGRRKRDQAHLATVGSGGEPVVHVTPSRSCGCSVGWLRSFTPWSPWRTGALA